MKQKKILIILENLPVPFAKRIWNEAKTLKEAGYGVSVIAPRGKGCEKNFEIIDGISIYRHYIPKDGRNFITYLWEYLVAFFWEFILSFKVLAREGFDAIHACNPPDNIFIIGVIFKLFGKKFVFNHLDLCPELYEAKFNRRGLLYRLMFVLERLSFMACDVSIAANESFKEIAVSRGKMKPERVFIVRSGPDTDKMRPVEPAPSLKEGRRFMVGYVGVMGKQDGIDYLLRAAEYARGIKKRNDILFVLIGSGPDHEYFKKYADKLKLGDTVKFTGRVSDDDLLRYLSTADVCVNPDVANDMNDKSTMNKVMEYMAMGRPVVQFDLKEGRVSAREASLYAKKNDAEDMAEKILELIDSPGRRRKMGEFGRERVEKELAWVYSKPNLKAAYKKLFEDRG